MLPGGISLRAHLQSALVVRRSMSFCCCHDHAAAATTSASCCRHGPRSLLNWRVRLFSFQNGVWLTNRARAGLYSLRHNFDLLFLSSKSFTCFSFFYECVSEKSKHPLLLLPVLCNTQRVVILALKSRKRDVVRALRNLLLEDLPLDLAIPAEEQVRARCFRPEA